jgi:thiol-disulfide isomerase/thioredoxin
MKNLCSLVLLGTILCSVLSAAPQLPRLWDAAVTVNGVEIPFRLEFSGTGKAFKAWFFNGDEKVVSTAGSATPAGIDARFDQYNSRLEAAFAVGVLKGTYTRDGKAYPVQAVPHRTPPAPDGPVPQIAGSWIVETGAATGEKAWSMAIQQTGAEVAGSILRVDGDTGELTGRFDNGRFTLSHFSGARPSLFVLTPAADGTLDILQNGTRKLIAYREAVAREQGLPLPEDPLRHIALKDPTQPLAFRFPDLRGHIVSNTDARFKGKVVILTLGGSWCPNCHDEAPLLEDLYRRYHAKGLEIVELSFEEAEQLRNPTRLRTYLKEYGITFRVLLAGEIGQLAEKLPQAVNLDTFPATFFIGRDGLVKQTHAGFAGKATGAQHEALVREIESTVQSLLGTR